ILVFITGVGSSTFHPSTYSIVSEKMGREHLAKSLAFHQFGGFLGGAAGTVLVAYLGSLIGWRYALLALPVPGILIIAAFWVTVKEEPKELRTNPTEVLKGFPSENSEFKLTAALLLIILFSFFSVLGDVTSNFLPAFLGNVYGSSVVDAGALASILQFVGCVGLLAGGTVADKLDKVNLTSTSQFIFGALVVLLASTNLLPPLLVLTIAAVGFFKFFAGPSIHALTSLTTPARARGRAFGLTF
ncbi:MAG: MFS transporter, partial [Candidatus Bathyarchaeia archaeon]